MLPSIRVMVRLAKNSPNSQSRMLEPTSVNRSKFVIPLRWRSDTGAAPQYKEDIEEITADYISDSHFRILFQCGDDGSGKLRQEVPPATSVNPIMDSLTPMLRAIPVAPLTNS